jgi:nicotinate-nucleotide adenylyltransferase
VQDKKRIGIFRGTFDPIHNGHISFAKKAIKVGRLDYVYFLTEPNPLHKIGVGDYQNRLEMVRDKLAPETNLKLLNKSGLHGSISKIIPALREVFKNNILVFLMGSDIAQSLPGWSDLESLTKNNEIIIGLRNKDTKDQINKLIGSLKSQPSKIMIIDVDLPELASSLVRKD